MPKPKDKAQILEGSRAIALTIKNIRPAVVSAYPITPQTHIVEDLSRFKADGEADYEYVRAESEFAAASIVEGASATGARVYTATSSQGLLLMAEVLYNIAGMRLPVVLTCANRGVSAPITIWNDHQDAMAVRDAGLLMFFAENHQEAVGQHILAYKVAEKLNLAAIVNVDGFVLTHSYEEIYVPSEKEIKKFLPDYRPEEGRFLDPKNPRTFGAFATPAHYMEIRQQLHDDLISALPIIKDEYEKYCRIFNPPVGVPVSNFKFQISNFNNGLLEYYGPKKAKTILIAMGSMVGTIKEVADRNKNVGVLKIKVYRPFPKEEILNVLKKMKPKNIAVVEKAIGLGASGPLASDVKAACFGKIKGNIRNFIVGLGGRDVTEKMIENIIKKTNDERQNEPKFAGK